MLGLGLILPLASTFIEPSFHLKIKNFLDLEIIDSLDEKQITLVLIIGVIFIYSIKHIFLLFFIFWKFTFTYNLQRDLTNNLLKKYLKKDYNYFVNKNSSELLRNINNVEVIGSLIDQFLIVISEVFLLAAIILLLLFIDPFSTCLLFVVFSIVGFTFFLFSRSKTKAWGEQRQHYMQIKIKIIQEILVSIKDIILLNKKTFFTKYFNENNNIYSKVGRNFEVIINLPRVVLEFIAIVLICSACLYLVLLYDNPVMSIPKIAIFAASGLRIMPSVSRLLAGLQYLNHHSAIITIIENEFKDKVSKKLKVTDFKKSINFENLVQIKNLTFNYNNKKVLKNLNFNFKKNDFVGIVGPSGTGKTTLVNLMTGLLKPHKGKILCDKYDINQNIPAWQSLLGYVSQNNLLIDDTIAKNIALGSSEIEIDYLLINKLLKQVGLPNFISKKNNKFKVGERASKLSGGQIQKILIARALYHKPKLLILDESTSNLDLKSENDILKLLKKLNNYITILIISHRDSTMKFCNKIIKLKKID